MTVWRILSYVAAIACGIVIGLQFRRPPVTVEAAREETKTAETKQEASQTAAASSVAHVVAGQTVVLRRWYPSGQLASEEKREAKTDTTTATTEKKASNEKKASTETAQVREIIKLTPRSPDWSVAVTTAWIRLEARPSIYGAAIDRRVLGPTAAGVFVLKQPQGWAGGVTLRVSW